MTIVDGGQGYQHGSAYIFFAVYRQRTAVAGDYLVRNGKTCPSRGAYGLP